MVARVFIRICISVENKSTNFYFARDVSAVPRIRFSMFFPLAECMILQKFNLAKSLKQQGNVRNNVFHVIISH